MSIFANWVKKFIVGPRPIKEEYVHFRKFDFFSEKIILRATKEEYEHFCKLGKKENLLLGLGPIKEEYVHFRKLDFFFPERKFRILTH